MSWRKEMIINHKNALLGRLLFKERSKKNWDSKGTKATKGNLMQIKWNKANSKLWPGIFAATPLRCGSAQAKQLQALYHQLPFPSTLGRSLWLLASQLAPMMTLFILRATLPLQPQLFYHNFVWQTICVFLHGRSPEGTWTAPDHEGNASEMWWEYTPNWSTVTIATR